MLNKIKGIKFKGAAFKSETTLLFSKDDTDRVSLVFGRNGSGKSTISRAISKAAGITEIEDIELASFVDSLNSDVTITEDERKKIFVFSEDYTNSQVRLKEDGLSSIVMFGEIGDISDKIDKATAALEKVAKDYANQDEKYAIYGDDSNIQSPKNQYEKVKIKLKGDRSWADRERLISGSKSNAAVTDTVISEIMGIAPRELQSDLLNEYDLEYAMLKRAISAGATITANIPTVNDYSDKIKIIKGLLAEKIEEPTLTNREKILLTLAQSGKQSELTHIKNEFSSEIDRCPFCLQSVTEEYKSELIKSIEKVLSKDAEEHGAALGKSRIQTILMEFSLFEIADKIIADSCAEAVSTVNRKIEKCNQAIEQKIANLYTPITDFTSELQESVNMLKIKLSELDRKKKDYNKHIGDIPQIKRDLKALNSKLAYYEIKDLYADYIKQKGEKDSEKSKLDRLASTLEKATMELDELNQQKKNIKIAVDFINRGLQYIFFSADKLKVEVSGDNYTLLSNNTSVKPKNISVGERNILALCYFFTELLNNVDEKDVNKDECFIVLDDPVSSFDLENRVGIISYLKSQIIKVLRGNPNSKILLLSHDLLTVYDVDKVLEEVANQIKVGNNDKKMGYKLFELKRGEITSFSCKKRNEYSQLLKTVYEYASNKSDEYELVIGNIMRRMLEAFGTFEYRKGIGEISCDQKILSIIAEEKRDYFENIMYRLILNGESHFEERSKSLTDNNFFATISTDEKKRTAKDVLCLMFLLNGNHIKAQFHAIKDDGGINAIKDIKKWVEAITISQKNKV